MLQHANRPAPPPPSLPCIRHSGGDGAPEGDLIGILQFTAKCYTTGDGADRHAEGFQALSQIVHGGFAFYRGAYGHDDFFDGALLHAFHQGFHLQFCRGDAFDGGNNATQHVVQSAILLGFFYGHEVADALDHTDGRGIAARVAAHAAQFVVGEVVALPTDAYAFAQGADGFRELFGHRLILLDEMEGQSKGCFSANAGQGGEGFHAFFNEFGRKVQGVSEGLVCERLNRLHTAAVVGQPDGHQHTAGKYHCGDDAAGSEKNHFIPGVSFYFLLLLQGQMPCQRLPCIFFNPHHKAIQAADEHEDCGKHQHHQHKFKILFSR